MIEEKWKETPDGKGGLIPPDDVAMLMEFMIGNNEPGALRCGTRIRKNGYEPGDKTPANTLGYIRGCLGSHHKYGIKMDIGTSYYAYMVEWDTEPGVFFGTVDLKVRKVDEQ